MSVNVAGLRQNVEILNATPGYWALSVAENIICYKRSWDGIVQTSWTAAQPSDGMPGLLSSYILHIDVLDEGI